MKIFFSYHAQKRMKQRGITELEVIYILQFPLFIKNSVDGTKEAVAVLNRRKIKIVFIPKVNYIKVITVM